MHITRTKMGGPFCYPSFFSVKKGSNVGIDVRGLWRKLNLLQIGESLTSDSGHQLGVSAGSAASGTTGGGV